MDLKIDESLRCGQAAFHGKTADLPANRVNHLLINKDRLLPAYAFAFAAKFKQPSN